MTGSLHDLVSDVVALTPPYDAVPVGTVMIALRHNKPAGIAFKGKKLRRGKGLPLTWKPAGIFVSTQDVPVGVTIRAIKMADEFPLVELRMTVVICVDPTDDFSALVSYIDEKGINFADLLDGEVATETSRMVRRCLRSSTSDQLYRAGSFEERLTDQAGLLGGLFRIVRLYDVQAEFHPEFMAIQELEARTTREINEKLSRLQQSDYERLVALADDQLVLDRATRRGQTMEEFENPELRSQREQRLHEREVAKINAFPELRGRDQLDRFERLFHGQIEAPPLLAADRGSNYDAPYDETFRYDEEPSSIAPVVTQAEQGTDWGENTEKGDEIVDLSLDQLKCDPSLLQVWRASGIGGVPAGLAFWADDEGCTVIAVSKDKLNAAEVTAAFTDRFGATSVIPIGGVSQLTEVIGRYLGRRVPELRTAEARLLISRRGPRLVLGLASRATRMRPIVKTINDPSTGILPALDRLLAYDAIVADVAEDEG